jgi:hypothetical protein
MFQACILLAQAGIARDQVNPLAGKARYPAAHKDVDGEVDRDRAGMEEI